MPGRGLVAVGNFEAGAAPNYLKVACTPGGAVAWEEIRSEMPAPFVADSDRIAGVYASAQDVAFRRE